MKPPLDFQQNPVEFVLVLLVICLLGSCQRVSCVPPSAGMSQYNAEHECDCEINTDQNDPKTYRYFQSRNGVCYAEDAPNEPN